MMIQRRWRDRFARSASGALSPAAIALLYGVLGTLWILLGDSILALVPERYVWHVSVSKGILYVLLTAVLLFFLIRASRRALQARAVALELSEERLKAVFRAAPTGIGVIRDRVFLEVNERVCTMLGCGAEDLLGQSTRVVYPTQEDYESVGREKYRLMHETGTGTVESCWQRQDGAVIDVLLSSTYVHADEPSAGAVFTVLDITERKHAQRALAEYRDHLEELVQQRTAELRRVQETLLRQERLAALGQLTGSVSHELRNPLGVVRAGVFVLARRFRGQDPEIDEVIDRTERGIARCSALVTDLLDYSRGGSLTPVPTELDAFLESCIREYAIPEHILVETDFRSGAAIPLDRERFRRCLINLLSNACDAIGTQGGTVRVKTAADGNAAVVCVEDSGCGIPPDRLEKVLEPLFSTKSFGVGLGLPIVRQIVEQHGGSIAMESRVGVGTTVTIRLPASDG